MDEALSRRPKRLSSSQMRIVTAHPRPLQCIENARQEQSAALRRYARGRFGHAPVVSANDDATHALPAITIPANRYTTKMPVGLEIVGHTGDDRSLLSCAQRIEDLTDVTTTKEHDHD